MFSLVQRNYQDSVAKYSPKVMMCKETRRSYKPHAIAITQLEMPSLARRKTSVTIRQRLTQAMGCSIASLVERKIRSRVLLPTLNYFPFGLLGFFCGNAFQFAALKSNVLIKLDVGWVTDLASSAYFLSCCLPSTIGLR